MDKVFDKVFKALSDPTRREVLRLLRGGDLSAGEIASRLSVGSSTLSGHLNVLKEARLVVAEKHGTSITYSLNVAVYEEMIEGVLELLGVGESGIEASKGRRQSDAYNVAD